jgi:hypothetical protein
VPTKSREVARWIACILAAGSFVHCASDAPKDQGSNFAKSLREADPTKKNAGKSTVDKSGNATSEFKLPGRAIFVEYSDAKLQKRLVLLNRESPLLTDDGDVKMDTAGAAVKVASDDLMADLCEAFRVLKFATVADASAPRGETPQWTLTYDVDGAKRTVSYVRGRDAETQKQCSHIQGAFLTIYNRVYGVRAKDGTVKGKEAFEDEKKRLQAANQATLKKAAEKP